MPKVTFVNEKEEVEVEAGTNLRQAALKAGLGLYGTLERYLNCRGLGMCGTCKVHVKSGMENLNPRTLLEKANLNLHPLSMLSSIGNENEIRLACQVVVNGDCSIETTPGLNISGENFWQKPFPNK
jgi:ferredoxin